MVNDLLLPVLVTCIIFLTCPVEGVEDQKSKALPEGIPHCRNVKDINICLKTAIEEMLPRLKDGDAVLNIPPLDPFFLEKSNYRYSRGNVQGRLALRNLKIVGISSTVITKMDFKVTENGTKMTSEVFTPKISTTGQYKAEFKFNDVKLQPKGNFNITMFGVSSQNVMEGEFIMNNTNRYLKLKEMNILAPNIEDMNIRVSGIFADPRLSEYIILSH
ncbi:hypothetical protein ACFFRR_003359 [Megaselia abdita]